jgi:hypothetical protein
MVMVWPNGGHLRGSRHFVVLSQEETSMNSRAFEALTRRTAGGISRRSSLLSLGGAALAATLVTGDVTAAKKKKKSGDKCKEKETKRCNKDAASCKDTVQPLCDPADPATCLILQNCCEECSANGFLECLILASAA